MKNIIVIAITIVVCLSFNCCQKWAMDKKYPIRLVNNSSKSIGFYFATGGVGGIFYPDTSLPISNQYVTYELKSGSTYEYNGSLSWEKVLREQFPADTLSIYVFSTDTLRTYEWAIIRSKYKILQRWDLSLQDLENKSYNIIYP